MGVRSRRAGMGTVLLAALTAVLVPLAVAVPTGSAAANPADSGSTADSGSNDDDVGRTTDDEIARVEAYLRRHVAEIRIPGLAYAVVRGTEVIGQGTWGVDGDGVRVTPQTPFVVGSVSKSFTALAVRQLVEAGRVELDAPVRRYVPELRLADESAAARITVRQLLTHTTGLPQVVTMGLNDRYDNTPDGLARSVRDLATLSPTMPPGEAHQYSNANYMILGLLVETVTGQTFGGYLREHVLDPLDMTHSAATEAEARRVGVPAGHRYYFGHPTRFAPPFDASGVPYGHLAASLSDLTHYAVAQLNDGRYGGATVLSPQGIAELHTGQVAVGGGSSYGLGWRESTLDGFGDRLVWHAGAAANYFSHILLVPGSDLAVVIMANVYGLAMDWPLASMAFNVARIMRGGEAVTAARDSALTWTLVGLLVVVGLLMIVLAWSVVRAVRRRRNAGVPAARRRIVAGTAGWVVGCAALAAGALWALPAMFDGASLAQAMLYTMDIGHAMVAVAVLAGAIALVRLAAAGYALFGRPGGG